MTSSRTLRRGRWGARAAIVVVGLLASRSLSSPTAGAWTGLFPCGGGYRTWSGSNYSFRVDTDDYAAGTWKHDAIHDIEGRWDGLGSPIPGSAFTTTHGTHTTGGTASYTDGVSTINFDSLTSLGYIGYTYCQFGGSCTLSACDIQIDSDTTSWVDGPADDSTPPYSFKAVLSHEFGHTAGLGHEDDYADTMNSNYPAGGSISNATLVMEDARVGLRALYSDSSTGTDLGLSSFFYDSDVSKAMRSPEATPLCSPQETHDVPGGQVKRSYCVHDLGTTSVSATLTYYLSTNQTITTADTEIGSFGNTFNPNQPFCYCRTLTIPSGQTPGTYWIGAIIDPSNSVSESNENNNDDIDEVSFTVD